MRSTVERFEKGGGRFSIPINAPICPLDLTPISYTVPSELASRVRHSLTLTMCSDSNDFYQSQSKYPFRRVTSSFSFSHQIRKDWRNFRRKMIGHVLHENGDRLWLPPLHGYSEGHEVLPVKLILRYTVACGYSVIIKYTVQRAQTVTHFHNLMSRPGLGENQEFVPLFSSLFSKQIYQESKSLPQY